MKRIPIFLLLLFLTFIQTTHAQKQLQIIPTPNHIELGKGYSNCKPPFKSNVQAFLKEEFVKSTDLFQTKSGKTLQLVLNNQAGTQPESYQLEIKKNQILISASDTSGFFYGIQTLRQLLETNERLPIVTIQDAPRFGYRGMHLDVSRHFYSVDFIKKQLEAMAYFKLNRFHWHLTDGAGWRIEIKKYPLLTQFAAWRPYANWKQWFRGERKYCMQDASDAQGGYYTQEEIKEVIRYAQDRQITIIPEIELPAHSEEVLATYPELSCSGIPYKNAEFCIGNEKTFEFLENVLTEVMDLFPGTCIHIGGDEANMDTWKSCPKCQQRMKENGMTQVKELQSYIVGRIGKFITNHGKRFIGWDEIVEGDLPQEAIIMSWRGESGGIKAAGKGHDVIMTPGEYCYFDAYQQDPTSQPDAIGGYLTTEKVYSYNPISSALSVEQQKHIKGVQANVWTEYMPTEEHVEYMIYPRLLALADVAWSNPELKDWDSFKYKVNTFVTLLKEKGYHPCEVNKKAILKQVPTSQEGVSFVELSTDLSDASIYYTVNGTTPTDKSMKYTQPIEIVDSILLKVIVYQKGNAMGSVQQYRLASNKAYGKKIMYNQKYSSRYPAKGENSLIDGLYGTYTYSDGYWQGLENDLDVVIDMERIMPIHRIYANFMQQTGPWIWLPTAVEISVSDNGEDFRTIYHETNTIPVDQEGAINKIFGFSGTEKARYIRYKATIYKSFIFTDEIVVE